MSSVQIPLPKAWSAGGGLPVVAPNWADVEVVAQQLLREANRLLAITSDPTLVAVATAAADTGAYWVNWVGAHGYNPSTTLSPGTTYNNLWQTLQVVQFFLRKELSAILGRRTQLLAPAASALAMGPQQSGGGTYYVGKNGGLLGQSPATAGRPEFGGPMGVGGVVGGKGPPSKTGPGGPVWSGSPILGKGGGGAKGLPHGGSFPDPRQFGVGGGGSGGGGLGGGEGAAGVGGASAEVDHHWKVSGGGGTGQASAGGGSQTGGGAGHDGSVRDAAVKVTHADGSQETRPGGYTEPVKKPAKETWVIEVDPNAPGGSRPADDDPRGSGEAPHAPYHVGLHKGPQLAPPVADANLLLPTSLWLQLQGTSGGSSAPQDDRGGNNPRFADPRLIYRPNPEDTSGGGGGDPRVFVYKPNPEDDGGGSGGGVGGPRGRVEAVAGAGARVALAGGGATTRAPGRAALESAARATIRRARMQ